MLRQFFILFFIVIIIAAFSFRNAKPELPAEKVKSFYLDKAEIFKRETEVLFKLIKKGKNKKQIQQQFLKTRHAYKQIEIFAEYFFPFYAGKLNGPPIPFFEEADPDKGEQAPAGLQLIESYIFPNLNKKQKASLQNETAELVRYATELPQVNESHEFNDNNIFDAVMEQLYRITALGLTGFDSQLANNSLTECNSSLNSIEQIINFYKEAFNKTAPSLFLELTSKLSGAQKCLDQHKDFNSFDRMEFILLYLNPVTNIIGKYKTANDYSDNQATLFYSAIKK